MNTDTYYMSIALKEEKKARYKQRAKELKEGSKKA